MKQTVNPVYRSLNRPLLVLGVERRLFFFLLTASFATFVASGALVPALVLFLALMTGARIASQTDPQFLRIVLNSKRFGVRYDPAKFAPEGGEARIRCLR